MSVPVAWLVNCNQLLVDRLFILDLVATGWVCIAMRLHIMLFIMQSMLYATWEQNSFTEVILAIVSKFYLSYNLFFNVGYCKIASYSVNAEMQFTYLSCFL